MGTLRHRERYMNKKKNTIHKNNMFSNIMPQPIHRFIQISSHEYCSPHNCMAYCIAFIAANTGIYSTMLYVKKDFFIITCLSNGL